MTGRQEYDRTKDRQRILDKYMIYLSRVLCLSVCHNCGTLSYSFSFSNQTDQEDETEGLEREGLKMERYGKGQIGEGGCKYTYHCLSLN